MNKIIQYIALILLVLICTTCDKEMITTGFPEISTSKVVWDGSNSYVFSGIMGSKKVGINEIGFIWQLGVDPLVKPGFKLIIGNEINSGEFQTEITNCLKKGSKYFVRAYALSGTIKLMGEAVDFVAGEDLPLKLSKFEPAVGRIGDTIKITGKRFNNTLSYNQVKFENIDAQLIDVNDTVIRCIVPTQLNTVSNTITVFTNGIGATFNEMFNLIIPPEPQITSISSNSVKYDNILTVYGHNLDLSPASTFISITGNSITFLLTPVMISSDSIKVEIYNQTNPTQLLGLTSYRIGIKMNEKSVLSDIYFSLISSWRRTTDFPGSGRYKSSSFSLGGNCYIGGGAGDGYVFKDLWKYNPVSELWARMADFPGLPRVYPNAFSKANFGYMGAGYSSDGSSKVQFLDFYKYDPSGDSWSSILNYPDQIANFYPGFTINANGRLFAGLSNQVLYMRELVNDNWISLSTIPEMIDCPASAVFAIGEKFYVIVGYRINNSISNSVWEYDSDSGAWTRKSDFPGSPRCASAFFAIGNYGYVGCGRSTDVPFLQQYQDMWKYNPLNDKWIRIEDFPGGLRSHLISLSDGSSGYAGLGIVLSSASYKNDFWKFNPK